MPVTYMGYNMNGLACIKLRPSVSFYNAIK